MNSLTIIIFVECYLFFLGQIAIHNCAHNILFLRSKRWNKIVGYLLCSMQLIHFEGWRAAHMLHHRYTNSVKDPHHVDRPLIPYIFTHYYRIAKVVWDPKRFFFCDLAPNPNCYYNNRVASIKRIRNTWSGMGHTILVDSNNLFTRIGGTF